METTKVNIPAAPEFERTVIGAILNEPEQLPEIVGFLTADCFNDPVNAGIYGVISQMYDANEQIDLFTVSQRCKAISELKAERIASRLAEYTSTVGSGAHLKTHAQVVKEAYIRRNILTSAHQLIARVSDAGEDLEDTLAWLSKIGDTSNELAAGGKTACHIGESLQNALKQAENRQTLAQSGRVSGITTGLADLDRITGGWQSSQLIVLAARPAMGKTALMLHFAKAAAEAGVPVCLYSLEMSDISLANRLILSECKVEVDAFRAGRLSPDDWRELEAAAERLRRLPIYVDDSPVVSMRHIKAHSKIMQRRDKCGLILVDYLQLADTAADKKNRNREQEIAQASRQAKIIAKELRVPFILLSQLSRNVEGRADKTPQLSDLRESGAIEQDADIVSFIYRPAYYGLSTVNINGVGDIDTVGVGFVTVAKQRDGATGTVPFRHNPSMTKITGYQSDKTATEQSNDEPF